MSNRKTRQECQRQDSVQWKPMREWSLQGELASPMASMEGMFLTALVDMWEQHDVMSSDVPNTFTQAKLNRKKGQA